jgi:hypothetical protein
MCNKGNRTLNYLLIAIFSIVTCSMHFQQQADLSTFVYQFTEEVETQENFKLNFQLEQQSGNVDANVAHTFTYKQQCIVLTHKSNFSYRLKFLSSFLEQSHGRAPPYSVLA